MTRRFNAIELEAARINRERVQRAAWREVHRRRRMRRRRIKVLRASPRKHLGLGRTLVSVKPAFRNHRHA